jgi:hypothetical protein
MAGKMTTNRKAAGHPRIETDAKYYCKNIFSEIAVLLKAFIKKGSILLFTIGGVLLCMI